MPLPYFGLRARISLAVMLATLLATVSMAFAAYRLQADETRNRFELAARTSFESDLKQALYQIQYGPVTDPATALTAYMTREQGISWALLDFTSGGRPPDLWEGGYRVDAVVRRDDTPPVTLPEELVDYARRSYPEPVGKLDVDGYLVYFGAATDSLVLVEFYNMGGLNAELAKLRWSLAAIALVVSTAGVATALFAAKRIQRPVHAVATAARLLGEGELSTRVPVRGRDELADLAVSFNAMAGQVGHSISELQAKDRQQRRFIDDVAHDLRTPIAAMVAVVDSLDTADAEVRSRSARLLTAQTRRLARLVEDLLEMSRFDAGVADFRTEPVDLAALVTDALELSAPSADVELRVHGDVTLTGDPRRLHTVARNLLINAIGHGAEPITVTIDGSRPESVTLRVADSGPGIPDELLPLLFDRFVRGDRARQATEGSGLGLAIADQNARLHGAKIVAANDGGAVFTVTVPRGVTTTG
ncbi:sensor histidine kinase [Amycolatopsis taiwanensis]|uniref:histidine kinase n=1 Tax=Amycolatopsis taiwanensis TaxID=342230 RepID=A0A9W6QTZ0_9PSEU|nr:HAMP domain-containing sensor histidine kinase [Amycolatopsis taiwanensis]GLY63986.1 two-component sensor histidine kinase [Amycolatopsis taiwanensis]